MVGCSPVGSFAVASLLYSSLQRTRYLTVEERLEAYWKWSTKRNRSSAIVWEHAHIPHLCRAGKHLKSAQDLGQSLPCIPSLAKNGFSKLADNSSIEKIFYNGTDIDDCSRMQDVEIPYSPRLLRVAELAEQLKVKPRTIYEMGVPNRIPYRKPPGLNISSV